MSVFQYKAMEVGGRTVSGVIEAEDRRSALHLLGQRGIFPSHLENHVPNREPARVLSAGSLPEHSGTRLGGGVRKKEITAFTREMAAMLESSIPIPQALD